MAGRFMTKNRWYDDGTNIFKGEIILFKQGKFLIVAVVLGLLASSFQFTADAATVEGEGDSTHTEKQREVSYHDANFEAMYNRLVTNWNKQSKSQVTCKQKTNKVSYKKQAGKKTQNNQPQPDKVTETPQPQPEPAQPKPAEKPEQVETVGQLNAFEQEVFELTNQERTKNGLKPLAIDYELSKVAREKSRDMAVNRYFDHTSPVYGSPFDMMRSYGIKYRAAGENIAKGQRTPAEVVNAWMNSPGHRANILNSSFTHIGVGYVEQGNHWTQQFIGK